jgi:hypothetical protein
MVVEAMATLIREWFRSMMPLARSCVAGITWAIARVKILSMLTLAWA